MNELEQNFPRPEYSVEKEKPPILYHASVRRDIAEFQPRQETVRDPNEGAVIFATPDRASAARFLVPVDGSWVQQSSFDNVHSIIISDEQRYRSLDKGGAVYSLPSDGFDLEAAEQHPHEWTSKQTVVPIDKVEYDSALEAMINHSVQIYFVDRDTLRRIQAAPDHGRSILQALQSENEKVGKNFVPIPKDEEGE